MRWKISTLSLTSLMSAYIISGQEIPPKPVNKPDPRIKVLPVPAFGYTPETGAYVGVVSLLMLDLYRDSVTRVSNAKLEFNYTWRKQVILETVWAYFFEKEKWYTQGTIHYSEYPDQYFGIGATTPASFLTHYQSRRFVTDINLLREIPGRFFAGPRIRYLNYHAVRYNMDTRAFQELYDAITYGLGYTLLKDTRNNLLNASEGVYLELTNTYNYTAAASYIKLHTDLRYYTAISTGTVGAVRLYNEFTFGSPPFFDYAIAGGDKMVRGYFYGRYRERNMSTLQGEIRQHIVWRIGLAAFGGITKLYADAQELGFRHIKPNYGGGIRFLIDRKDRINLRLDYAAGVEGQNGFYISFGESF